MATRRWGVADGGQRRGFPRDVICLALLIFVIDEFAHRGSASLVQRESKQSAGVPFLLGAATANARGGGPEARKGCGALRMGEVDGDEAAARGETPYMRVRHRLWAARRRRDLRKWDLSRQESGRRNCSALGKFFLRSSCFHKTTIFPPRRCAGPHCAKPPIRPWGRKAVRRRVSDPRPSRSSTLPATKTPAEAEAPAPSA